MISSRAVITNEIPTAELSIELILDKIMGNRIFGKVRTNSLFMAIPKCRSDSPFGMKYKLAVKRVSIATRSVTLIPRMTAAGARLSVSSRNNDRSSPTISTGDK